MRKKPGLTIVVVIPNGATSCASAPIHPSNPALDAAYTDEYSKPRLKTKNLLEAHADVHKVDVPIYFCILKTNLSFKF